MGSDRHLCGTLKMTVKADNAIYGLELVPLWNTYENGRKTR